MKSSLDTGAVPVSSTIRIRYAGRSRNSSVSDLSNRIVFINLLVWYTQCKAGLACLFDGAEIGSTGSIAMWSYPDVSSVNANKTLNANDNFAPQEFAQAA